MDPRTPTESGPNPVFKPLTIKTIGIGGAGGKILEQLARDGVPAESLIAIHSDASTLASSPARDKINIESKTSTVALSTTAHRDAQLARVKDLCSGTSVVFLVA